MKSNMISCIIDLDRVAYSGFLLLLLLFLTAYLSYLFLTILPHEFG